MYDITGLTALAVPSGKTLTLGGTGNTVAGPGDLNLSGDTAGTLIVDGTLTVPGTITGKTAASNITIKGTLDFGVADAAISFTGVTINNNGTVSTAATAVGAPNTIAALGGVITSIGDVTGTDVHIGRHDPYSHGSFAGGAGAITVAGTATFTTSAFENQKGKVTVADGGNATFTLGTFAGLAGEAGTAIVEVEKGGTAVFTAAIFASTTLGKIVIAGEVSFGAAAPAGDITVTNTGAVNVPDGASLAIAAGKTLANAGMVALAGTGSAVLNTTAATSGGAKLIGAGKLTAGNTEIVGGVGGWTADLTTAGGGEKTVIIASLDAATAKITDDATANLVAGTGTAITQLAGAGNGLTIAADTTIDLGSDGVITLTGDATAANRGKTALANGTASVIKTRETEGSGKTGSIPNATVTNLTLKSSDANKLASITSKAADDCAIKASGEANATISAATVVGD